MSGAASAPLVFAYGAGLLATVNPCGFALLPGYLALLLGAEDDSPGRRSTLERTVQGLAVGLAVTAGFAGVFIVAAALLSLGLRPVLSILPWTSLVIGAALGLAGLALLAGRRLGLRLPPPMRDRPSPGYAGAILYGAAYALASLSCSVAILLVVVAEALASPSLVRVAGMMGSYTAGVATILVSLTVCTALARSALLRWVRGWLPLVSRLAGALLVLSGAYLIAYWMPQALHPGTLAPAAVAALPQRASAALTALVSAHQTLLALLGAVLAVIGVMTTAGLARSRAGRRSQPQT